MERARCRGSPVFLSSTCDCSDESLLVKPEFSFCRIVESRLVHILKIFHTEFHSTSHLQRLHLPLRRLVVAAMLRGGGKEEVGEVVEKQVVVVVERRERW